MSSSCFSNLGVSLPFASETSTGFGSGSLSVVAISDRRSNGNNVKPMAGRKKRNFLEHLQFAFPSSSKIWNHLNGVPGLVDQLMTMEKHMLKDYSSILDALPRMLDEAPWEIQEGFHDYMLRFYLPGMSKDELKVSVKGKILVVKAERAPVPPKEEKQLIASQGKGWFADSYISYSKQIELPDDIEIHRIKAEIDCGVLCLTIPKRSHSKRALEININ